MTLKLHNKSISDMADMVNRRVNEAVSISDRMIKELYGLELNNNGNVVTANIRNFAIDLEKLYRSASMDLTEISQAGL